ncbi:MAG: hypothetical protein KC503_10655 [Myxococcales bacterium]|nr:hypothetical protein [Myxococcales bacterium]
MQRNSAVTVAFVAAALVITSWAAPAEARRHRERIAVVPISASTWKARRTAHKATRRLLRLLRRSRRFRTVLLPRSRKMRRCLQLASCVNRIAKRYRVKMIVAGHAERMGRRYHVDLRVVSQDGEVLKSASFRGYRSTILWRGSALAYRLTLRARRALRTQRVAAKSKPKADRKFQAEIVSRSDAAAVANLAGMPAQDKEDPDAKAAAEKKAAKGTKVAALGNGVPAAAVAPPVRREPGLMERLWSRRYLHAWATAGAGLAALGAGAVFGTISLKANQASRDEQLQPQAWTMRDKAQKNALTANILFAAGGAAVATSLVLFYLEYKKETRELRAKDDGNNLSIGVNVAREGGGISLKGRF